MGRPSRRNPTWAPSPIRPPFLIIGRGEREERGEEGKGGRTPTSFSYLASFLRRVYHPLWAGVLPSYGP